MIVISSAVVLADVADSLSLDHPIIGWRNVVTASTIVADAADANYPASNLANPATHLEWRGSISITGAANNGGGAIRISVTSTSALSNGQTIKITGVVGTTEANGTWVISNVTGTTFDLNGSVFSHAYVSGGAVFGQQYLTITTNEVDPIDYIAIARHNFFSAEISPSIEGFISGVWTQIVEPVMLADDGPLIFRFTAQSLSQVRIKLPLGSDIPRAAVVYCGKLLVIERKIYVGHTPLPHARKSNIANGRSESGNFLGRIVLGSWRESNVPLSLISPDWYRENMDPFLAVAKDTPFFFGWRPHTYPFESGFAWLTDDPMPTPDGTSHLIAFDLHVGGVV